MKEKKELITYDCHYLDINDTWVKNKPVIIGYYNSIVKSSNEEKLVDTNKKIKKTISTLKKF